MQKKATKNVAMRMNVLGCEVECDIYGRLNC